MSRIVLIRVALALLLAGLMAGARAEPALRLGVLAFRPSEQARAEYQPLADYLQGALGRQIALQTYNLDGLEQVVRDGEVDVVLTNPGHFILLRHRYGLSAPLATQLRREAGHDLAAFGAVIVRRSDQTSIRTLSDLAGQRIAVSSPDALGSYQMQAYEMLDLGLALPRPEQLVVTGLPQDRVLEAVLQGRADAGFVRSGVLETMAREGRLDPARVTVIHPQQHAGYPFAASTRLYPEWPVAVTDHVGEALARRLAVALLSLPPGVSDRLQGVRGFALPADYREVEALLRGLRIPPFDTAAQRTLSEIWEQHAAQIAAVMALLVLTFAALGWRLRQQNRRLQQSQQRFTTLFEHSPEPMWILDDGRFVDCNSAAVRKLGYGDKAATLMRRPSDISPEFQPDGELSAGKFERILQQVARGHPQRFEWLHLKADGSAFMADVSLAPAILNGRSVVLCAWYDITQQKSHEKALLDLKDTLELRVQERTVQLQEQREFLGSILNSTGALVMVLDRQGCFVQVNAAFERLTGYRQEELLGTPIWESIIPPSRRATVKARHQHLTPRAKLARDIEVEWMARDGQPLLISLNNALLNDASGELAYIVASGIDVTERKRAERALLTANERLSRSLETLQHTQAQLVQAEKMAALGGLVAGISHEINTPLGIGVTAATSLQEQLRTLKRAFEEGAMKRSTLENYLSQSLEGTDILVRNLMRAADLISSFKQVAVDQSSDERREFDLGLYIDEVVLSLQPRFKGRRIRVVNASEAGLRIDSYPGAIYQVLSNLLLNALLHAYDEDQEGLIRLEARRCGDEIWIDCADDGKGIPAEIQDRIFDPFFTTRRGTGGSGLGLHIVFNLVVTTLRGSIQLRPGAARGTTFRISFPLTSEPRQHEHAGHG